MVFKNDESVWTNEEFIFDELAFGKDEEDKY